MLQQGASVSIFDSALSAPRCYLSGCRTTVLPFAVHVRGAATMTRLSAVMAACSVLLLLVLAATGARAQQSPNIQALLENPVYRPLAAKVRCALPAALGGCNRPCAAAAAATATASRPSPPGGCASPFSPIRHTF